MSVFNTAVHYQLYHSLALFGVSVLLFHICNKWVYAAGLAFILGMFLFSGSLYVLCLFDLRTFGMVTPLGGLSFLCGWLFLCIGVLSTKRF